MKSHEMPKRLAERRDERAALFNVERDEYELGFDDCWEELAPVVEALVSLTKFENPSCDCHEIARQALTALEKLK